EERAQSRLARPPGRAALGVAADPGLDRGGAGRPVVGAGKEGLAARNEEAGKGSEEGVGGADAVEDVERTDRGEGALPEGEGGGAGAPEVDRLPPGEPDRELAAVVDHPYPSPRISHPALAQDGGSEAEQWEPEVHAKHLAPRKSLSRQGKG